MLSLNQSVAPPVSAGDPAEPVTITEAKLHLRVDDETENVLIGDLVKAARGEVENLCGRQLLTATWIHRLDAFPGSDSILLPVSPVQSITSVEYTDLAGSSQTVNASVYDSDVNSSRPRIFLKYGQTWPSAQSITNAITITFVAGYGDDRVDVPECARRAILMLVGTLYRNRETVITGMTVSPIKGVLEALLDPITVWEFA